MENGNYPVPRIDVFADPNRSRLQPMGRQFSCAYESCGQVFYRYSTYDNHFCSVHVCQFCNSAAPDLINHECPRVQIGSGLPVNIELLPDDFESGKFELYTSVHLGTILMFKNVFKDIFGSVESCFEDAFDDLLELLMKLIDIYKGIRAQINLNLTLEHNETGQIRVQTFQTPFVRYTYKSEDLITTNILAAAAYIISSLNVYSTDGSSWSLRNCNFMQLKVIQYRVKRGGRWIKTPKELRSKLIINIKTGETGDCFALSALASLYRDEIRLAEEPESSYQQLDYHQRTKLKAKWQNPRSYI